MLVFERLAIAVVNLKKTEWPVLSCFVNYLYVDKDLVLHR